MRSARPSSTPLLLLAALLAGACGDASPSSTGPSIGASGDAAGDARPPAIDRGLGPSGALTDAGGDAGGRGGAVRSPLAGIWTGTTSQGLPVAFLVDDVGRVSSLSIRLRVEYGGGRTCDMSFHALQTELRTGSATAKVRSLYASFTPDVALEVAGESASGTFAGFEGAYEIECGTAPVAKGTGPALPAGTWTARKLSGPPQPGPDHVRVIGGRGTFIGRWETTCTHEEGAKGDRWCGFATFGSDGVRLWVLNRTVGAQRPTDVACSLEGGNPNCLLVSRAVYSAYITRGTPFPRIHRFDGDTLIATESRATLPSGRVTFPVTGWRPGWPAARRLVDDGVCAGHGRTDAVVCSSQADPTGQAADAPSRFELRAGRLGDGSAPLPLVDTVITRTAAERDADAPAKYKYGLSPDGTHVVWSGRTSAAGPETVFTLRLGDAPERKRVLASGVASWSVSSDGTKIYWLRGFDGAAAAPQGTLEMADFPAGGTPTVLLSSVASYSELQAGATSGLVASLGTGAVVVMRDRARPAAAETLERSLTTPARAPDGKTLVYTRATDPNERRVGALVRASLTSTPANRCTVNAAASTRSNAVFSTRGDSVLFGAWAADGSTSGVLGSTTACTSAPVVDRLEIYKRTAANDFVALGQAHWTGLDAVGTLGVIDRGPDGAPRWSPIMSGVTDHVGLREWEDERQHHQELLYTVEGGWATDGLYVTRLEKTKTPGP